MLIRILLFIWQLPQNLLGLGLILLCMIRHIDVKKEGQVYVLDKFWAGGVSLGEYIFVYRACNDEDTRQHELGHRVQSRLLGPLYLMIVGLPSAILCVMANHSRRINETYFDHFPENWADKLGHIKRHK